MKKPPCFDSLEQYRGWLEAAKEAEKLVRGHRANYCNDCLPGYQKLMIEQHRCKYPNVVFIKMGINAFFGRRPKGHSNEQIQPDD